jgi:hypothetical protein
MIIRYVFNEDDNEVDKSTKKRKVSDSKLRNILEYSQIKLPALMFLNYLENYSAQFLDDCLR